MSSDENWRVVARRRQRQLPVEDLRWWVADAASRALLRPLLLPAASVGGLGLWAMLTHSRALGGVALIVAVLWAVRSWYLFDRRTRSGRGVRGSGSHLLDDAEIARRADAEDASHRDVPFAAALSPAVTTAMWDQHGDLLLERERQVQALAERLDWTFHAFDLSTTTALDRASVTSYTPSTCRNVCRGQRRQVPFLLTDLTRVRFDLGSAATTPRVDLTTATMCVLPFSAPQKLRIVSRTHWLADIRLEEDPISTESSAFNADYRIVGKNNAWSRLVLNPGFVDLVMTASVTSLVIDGGRFAVAVEPWHPVDRYVEFLDLTLRLHASALTAAAPEAEEPITYYLRTD